jgi:DMSO reductase family type II enzyme heme b subunit|tara:strand:- start:4701 stop:5348 length:648 start_codon:yes stop_codon:yes gene_type:complete
VRVQRHSYDSAVLADGRAPAWGAIKEQEITLIPAPLTRTAAVSPYLSRQTGHGRIHNLRARLAHDGTTLSIRLAWHDPDKDDELKDLDQFTDGVAVMFPLAPGASAMAMGAREAPINAWFWKADENEPFDVFAEGYATSHRRSGADSGLTATGYHDQEHWVVVLQRPLTNADDRLAGFRPGSPSAIAFAAWAGSNKERSGQKSVSGEFVHLTVDA